MMAPVVDQIADEVTGQASVYKIDIDQSADIASRYNVMSVPTFMVFNQGSVTNSTVGAQPKSVLLGLLSK
jgi:thioredoxin 1